MYSLEAIDRIRNHKSSEPMFLYLAYQAVHSGNLDEDPLQAPQEWINKFSYIKHKGRQDYAAMMGVMDFWIGQVRFFMELIFIFTKCSLLSLGFISLILKSNLRCCCLKLQLCENSNLKAN